MNHLIPSLMLACALVSAAQSAPPTLATFDEDVAICRRIIRSCCAILQDMAKEKTVDVAKKEEGLRLLADARAKWAAIEATYADSPPAEYAADPLFRVRLQDIANAADDMERALSADQPRRSMLACGYACGLFVTMHEENGLEYALDKLFHLRKTAKTAQAAWKARGPEALQTLLPPLLRGRDEVVLAPLPWPEGDARNDAYLSGVRALSATLDELARAWRRGDQTQLGDILKTLVTVINVPYGAAL